MNETAIEPNRIRIRFLETGVMGLVALGLLLAYWMRWTSSSSTEIFGFISGGICVWLGVRQSVWTWPFGLANNLAFFRLFWIERLFADAFLQVIFFSLGVYGWWNWLRVDADPDGPPVEKTRWYEWLGVVAFTPLATWMLREILLKAHGASPFWDALTAVLSLAAQYLMCRKRLENWLVWIVADIIYVPLYLSRRLPLTAVLYFAFLLMCIAGFFQWRDAMLRRTPQCDTSMDL